jgi:death on curing protein
VKTPVWILEQSVLALHERLLAEFGGSSGVRDQGLLESALARPENLHAYETPTIFALAASYAFGIVKNHAFVDGNKRTGFATAVLFLELNGQHFEAAEADATIQTFALAAGALDEDAYAAWLEANSRRQPRR